MTRYRPSRNYLVAGLVALAMAGFSAWCATRWTPTLIPALLFLVSAAVLFFMAARPVIEIHPHHLRIGSRAVAWTEIKAVDLTGWTSPLVVKLTLLDGRLVRLIYPGELDSALALLRHLRRMATDALIDGVPHDEYLRRENSGRGAGAGPRNQLASPRYPLLREDDEAEVERLFQRLKTVGHLDPKNNGSEEN